MQATTRDRFEPCIKNPIWKDLSVQHWTDWKWQQRNRIRSALDLKKILSLSAEQAEVLHATQDQFRMAITPYYASLMDPTNPRCPIRAQSVPTSDELMVLPHELEDPLAEESHMPVRGITHRYPDRVLFYVTHHCPVYCRHCTRKRKVSNPTSASHVDDLQQGIQYIRSHPEVRDVLISGGDPLSLSDERLKWILFQLREIPHVEILRICTRNLVTLPFRITDELVTVIKQVQPVYVHTHFNHPRECTQEAFDACAKLADAGAVLQNQMVFLKDVNDDANIVKTLNQKLLLMRVRPYYIFQCDMAQGLTHFRISNQRAIEILDQLRGWTSGMAVPTLAIDLPGGGGKVPLIPDYFVSKEGNRWTFRNYEKKIYHYEDVPE